MTRVLVAYATKEGSTAEIAETVAATLREQALYAETREVGTVSELDSYDTVIVGSAVYMFHWRKEAVRLLSSHKRELIGRRVWLFQSGPLDKSAEEKELALPKKVAKLAKAIGIRGFATFGGKLRSDADSRMARKMSKGETKDFRSFDQIKTWAKEIASELP